MSDQLKELLVRYNLLSEHIQRLDSQVKILQALYNEIESTLQALKALKNVEKGRETLVPLGSSVFLKVTIADTEKALINVGRDVYIEKKIDNIIESLEEKRGTVLREITRVNSEIARAIEEAERLRREIENLASQGTPQLEK